MCQESLLGALHASVRRRIHACVKSHCSGLCMHLATRRMLHVSIAIWCLSGFRAWVVGYAERGASTREGRIYWVFVEQ